MYHVLAMYHVYHVLVVMVLPHASTAIYHALVVMVVVDADASCLCLY